MFASQTDDPYFPIPFDEAKADIAFRELTDSAEFEIADVKVACARLNHPYIATAYRLSVDGASVAYVSDTAPFTDILFGDQFVARPPSGTELPKRDQEKLSAMRDGVVRLCEGADLVIYDTMFTPEDYQRIPHYGHSRPSDALEICREAGARSLALFHHAPERSDAEVDAILAGHPGRRQTGPHRSGRGGRVRRDGPGAGAAVMELTFWGVRGSIPAPGLAPFATAATPPASRCGRATTSSSSSTAAPARATSASR